MHPTDPAITGVHIAPGVNVGGNLEIHDVNIHNTIVQGSQPKPPPPPFMAPDPPSDFVPRPQEMAALIAHLLTDDSMPVAITAALRGAGGYGKTTLAQILCHDTRVRNAFPDGILWVTLGEHPNVVAGLTKLYAALTGDRPLFVDAEDGAAVLSQSWGKRRCLLVVDDVWDPTHLHPFLRGGDQVVRLITTRDADTLPLNTSTVDVDAMRREEAEQLLTAGIPTNRYSANFQKLARRLGEWPLLLTLVNGALRQRLQSGETLVETLAYVNQALDRKGLTFFDARNPTKRTQAVTATLQVSLDLLSEHERDRFRELAIFPEDTDVPLQTVAQLWRTTGAFDEFDSQDLCHRLHRLSLLQHLDLAAATLRLHDVIRTFLFEQIGEQAPNVHEALLRGYSVDGHWADLPRDEPYLWHHLAYHLLGAAKPKELYDTLLTFSYVQAKLAATDVKALMSDFNSLPHDEELHLIYLAVRMSAHLLAQDPRQLVPQLLGRLIDRPEAGIQRLLSRAKPSGQIPWLRPLTARLDPPGGPRTRALTEHTGGVNALAVMPDGAYVFSASWDKTVKLWDLHTGEVVRILSGSTSVVYSIAVTPDGTRLLSVSADGTLRLWDIHTDQIIRTLAENTVNVVMVAWANDAAYALVGSRDGTLRLWDLYTCAIVRVLEAHSQVNAVTVAPDGAYVLSAYRDNTIRLWDLHTGKVIDSTLAVT